MSKPSTYQPPYTITPDILNRVAAISEAIGRRWQSLILARWNPLFADIPVESLIFEHQTEYYLAIQESTHKAYRKYKRPFR